MCCDGIVIVTEVPLIGKCTGGDGGVVGEGEGVVGEAEDVVIGVESGYWVRGYVDIERSGVGTTGYGSGDKFYGIGSWGVCVVLLTRRHT